MKQGEGKKDAISELKPLIRGQRAVGNSANSAKTSGSLADRVARTLIYGTRRKSDTGLKIENKESDKRPRQTIKNENRGGRYKEILEKYRNWKLGQIIPFYNGGK